MKRNLGLCWLDHLQVWYFEKWWEVDWKNQESWSWSNFKMRSEKCLKLVH